MAPKTLTRLQALPAHAAADTGINPWRYDHLEAPKAGAVQSPVMELRYRDGSIIFVDPDIEASQASYVVVRICHEAKAEFKQLVTDGTSCFVRSLNPHWPSKLIKMDHNTSLCGAVTGQFIAEQGRGLDIKQDMTSRMWPSACRLEQCTYSVEGNTMKAEHLISLLTA